MTRRPKHRQDDPRAPVIDRPAPHAPSRRCGPRRAALRSLAGIVAGALAGPVASEVRRADIVQPAVPGPAGFALRAAEMRRLAIERGDQPYGAVIVKDWRIVGEGVSAVITDADPTAHAEMQAIRDAARRLATRNLAGCSMYGTSPACPMCAAAAYWAGISRMYHGEAPTDAGVPKLC